MRGDFFSTPAFRDIWNGWTIGAGFAGASQARFAIRFYEAVAKRTVWESIDVAGVGPILLTGHSLGGGLAGFVGAVSTNQSIGFDHMPYGLAAWAEVISEAIRRAAAETELSLDDIAPILLSATALPVALSPLWTVGTFLERVAEHLEGLAPYTASLTGTYTVGEALQYVRDGTIPFVVGAGGGSLLSILGAPILGVGLAAYGVTLGLTTRDLEEDVEKTGLQVYGAELDPVERHSPGLVPILLFGEKQWGTEGGDTDWKASAKYFLTQISNEELANTFGLTAGATSASEQLTRIIAYSAINEGEDSARPFGDLGIRALFDDADELGKAVTEHAEALASVLNEDARKIVGELIFEYAGLLATKRASVSGGAEALKGGVLSFGIKQSTEVAFTIDFREETWTVPGEEAHETSRKETLIDLFLKADQLSYASIGEISSWYEDHSESGESLVKQIDVISMSVRPSAIFDPEISEKVMLLIGSDEADSFTFTSGDDFVMGVAGEDRLSGRDGTDILLGGAGEDILEGEAGDDWLDGGGDADYLFGGTGEDELRGGSGMDQLTGGDGADVLKGGDGVDVLIAGLEGGRDDGDADELHGGIGNDDFFVNDGDKITAVGPKSLERDDKVYLDNHRLTGGEREAGSGSLNGTYENKEAGAVYRYSNGTLTVTLDDSSITIEKFQNGDAGIYLRRTDPAQRLAESQTSPLVIDLDGDGLDLTSLSGSTIWFDVDDDGFAERTSWVKADDGLLAVDRNGDGRINSAAELFGTNPLIRPNRLIHLDVEPAFHMLDSFDTNRDRLVDARDDGFAALLIWRDFNQDGESDPGELFDLASLGVASLSLDYARVNIDENLGRSKPGDGWTIYDRSRATLADGRIVELSDVFFAVDQQSSRPLETADPAALAGVEHLPFLIGSGNVVDLHMAMTRDPLLRDMVEELAATTVADLASFTSRVADIVLRWAGVDPARVLERGPNVNGAWLEAIEAFNGQPYLQRWSPDPRQNGGSIMGWAFNDLVGYTAAALFGQTEAARTVLPGFTFAAGAFFELEGGASLADLAASAAAQAPQGLGDAIGYWQLIANSLEQAAEALGLSETAVRAALAPHFPPAFGGISYGQLRTAIWTSEGNEIAVGNGGGLNGPDTGFASRDGADFTANLYVLRAGRSEIYDNAGADRYVISGTGVHSEIKDAGFSLTNEAQGGPDLLLFELSLFSDLTFTFLPHAGNGEVGLAYAEAEAFDLIIRDEALDITIVLDRAIVSHQSGLGGSVPRFRFADGTEIGLDRLWSDAQTESNVGIVFVTPEGEPEDGGPGDDLLIGSGGNDLFGLKEGSGRDRVIDRTSGDGDVLRIGAAFADVSLAFSDDYERRDVILTLATGDSVRLIDQTGGSEPVIARFLFSDGIELSAAELNGVILKGGAGDDRILGTKQADVVDGGAGNDRLEGREGGDTYLFSGGSGHDEIFEEPGGSATSVANSLYMVGIAWADVVGERTGANRDDLRLTLLEGGDSITIRGLFSPERTSLPVSTILFSDGVRTIAEVVASLPAGEATITGTFRDDELTGTLVNDSFEGLAGDDRMEDHGGDDDYRFGFGSGRDVVDDRGESTDRLVFANDIALGDLRFSVADTDLLIDYGRGDRITLVGGAVTWDSGSPEGVETITRSDGTFSLSVVFGGYEILGSAGDELLISETGAGTFAPGAGTDVIVTGAGYDYILLNPGFGRKYISQSTGDDRIVFGGGIAPGDLTFSRDGRDLVISLADGSELHWRSYFEVSNPVSLKGWDEDGEKLLTPQGYDTALDLIEFEVGGTVGWQAIDALFFEPDESDQILLRSGTLDGGGGNDILEGDSASNTYVFGEGYGHDTIRDFEGGTIIISGVGMAAAASQAGSAASSQSFADGADSIRITGDLDLNDLLFSFGGDHDEDIVITIGGTGETLTVDRDAIRSDGAPTGEIETIIVGGASYDFASLLAGMIGASEGDDRIRAPSRWLMIDALGGSDRIELGLGGGAVLFGPEIGAVGDADVVGFAADVSPSFVSIEIVINESWTFHDDIDLSDATNAVSFRPLLNGDRVDLVIAAAGRSLTVEGGIGIVIDGSFATSLSGVQFYDVWLDANYVISNALAPRAGT